jgi:ATP-binding cassette subfamily C (CFTR/MRP) protein 1
MPSTFYRGLLACRGAPIEAIAILVLLATLVGIYCLPGVGVVCLVVPAQYYFGFRIIKNKVANQPNVNERFSIIQVNPQ